MHITIFSIKLVIESDKIYQIDIQMLINFFFLYSEDYYCIVKKKISLQSTGKGGQAFLDEAGDKIASMKAVKERIVTVNFNADVNSSIVWNFKPQQPYIKVNII